MTKKLDLGSLMPPQREVVTTFDRPVFVSAGAGSGKTFTLTRRILMALSDESGPVVDNLSQVLAITFTKDAAAELRDRIRQILVKYGRDDDALDVDDACISTIHGMCSQILREHAFELKIDPDFAVIEGAEADELIDEAYDYVISHLGTVVDRSGRAILDPDGPFHELFSWIPVKGYVDEDGREAGTSAHSIACSLVNLAPLFPNGTDDIEFVRGSFDVSGLADTCRGYIADFGGGKKKPAGVADAERTLEVVLAFEAGPKTKDDVVALMHAVRCPRATKTNKEAAAYFKAVVSDTLVNAYLAASEVELGQLEQLVSAVYERYRSLKHDRGVLDNNDLLRLAHDALAKHPWIRDEYEQRFKLVMIDEFQDTDQLQIDLVSMLTGEGEHKLCTVGDAQQSIYRFRGAEVEVFRAKERKIAGTGANGARTKAASAAPRGTDGATGAPAGSLVKLTRNFRSHAKVLEYVSRVFNDAEGGIMLGFLDLEPDEGHEDRLVPADAPRASAILTVGGTSEERRLSSARSIARRFRALADAGQPAGSMVILLGGMTHADVYAGAVREQGLDCVISGGTVFASTAEVKAVQALLRLLANPADTEPGLLRVLCSPMFAFGVEELLALATKEDEGDAGWSRRNIDEGILASASDVPGLADLPLVARAREVLSAALARVGRDPVAAIARDVVSESGWLVRLAGRGAEGRAVAANVLKALDMVAEIEAETGNAPRRVSLAFDRALLGKEAPGALTGEGSQAVEIMTVHASKGLEYPVVAVAECCTAFKGSGRFQLSRSASGARVAVLPSLFPSGRKSDGSFVPADKVGKAFSALYKPERLSAALVDEVCGSDSALGAFIEMRTENAALELEEKARLLYVAMTRAQDAVILALDAGCTSRDKVTTLAFDEESDLTGRVLGRILPSWPALDADRLALEDSRPGDFELVALNDFVFEGASYTASRDGGAGEGDGADEGDGDAAPAGVSAASAGKSESVADFDPEGPDTFTIVRPDPVAWRVTSAPRPERASYSYSSLSSKRKEEAQAQSQTEGDPEPAPVPSGPAPEDRVSRPASGEAPEASDGGAGEAPARAAAGDPTALGSAFHAAAQWLIDTGSETVPSERLDALARFWGVTEAQRRRLDAAIARWERSAVRAEMRSWPRVLAEVPFYSLGMEDEPDCAGLFAEGAIDVLCSDPSRPGEAFVIDYKTGGSPSETRDELLEKHGLQASVYADVLHKAGFSSVELAFVRVEVDDPDRPGEPEVVRFQKDVTVC